MPAHPTERRRRAGKRLFDVAIGGAALLLLSPLLLVVAAAIRLDSPGPALFRQQRVGRHGVPFAIHKFRTMTVDAPARGLGLTVGTDARITRLGRRLRGVRIDELPQLLDVMAGHMSLVGPRPELPRYVAFYPADLRARVLAVRPGMTDPASLAHMDEDALLAKAADPERMYIDDILPTKLQLSADYADRATIGSDVVVLCRTVARLLGR